MRRCERATGRSAASAVTDTPRKTMSVIAVPPPAALVSAATSAPAANGARKNPMVAISPTASTTAAISQSTHASIDARNLTDPRARLARGGGREAESGGGGRVRRRRGGGEWRFVAVGSVPTLCRVRGGARRTAAGEGGCAGWIGISSQVWRLGERCGKNCRVGRHFFPGHVN